MAVSTPVTVAILVAILGFATIVAIAFLTYKLKAAKDAEKATLLPYATSSASVDQVQAQSRPHTRSHMRLASQGQCQGRLASSVPGTPLSPKQKQTHHAPPSPLPRRLNEKDSTLSFPASTRRFIVRRGLAVRVPSSIFRAGSRRASRADRAQPQPSRTVSLRSDAASGSGSGWSWSNRGAPSWLVSADSAAVAGAGRETEGSELGGGVESGGDVEQQDRRSAVEKGQGKVEVTERGEARWNGARGKSAKDVEMQVDVIKRGIVNAVTRASVSAMPALAVGSRRLGGEPEGLVEGGRGGNGEESSTPEMVQVPRRTRTTSPTTPAFSSTPLRAFAPSTPRSPWTPGSPDDGRAPEGRGVDGDGEVDSPTRALLLKSRYYVDG